jgi:hypothetical protein
VTGFTRALLHFHVHEARAVLPPPCAATTLLLLERSSRQERIVESGPRPLTDTLGHAGASTASLAASTPSAAARRLKRPCRPAAALVDQQPRRRLVSCSRSWPLQGDASPGGVHAAYAEPLVAGPVLAVACSPKRQ